MRIAVPFGKMSAALKGEHMLARIAELLTRAGLAEAPASAVAYVALAVGVLALGWLVNQVTHRLLLRAVRHLISLTRTHWDDALIRHRVLRRAAGLVPAVVIYVLAPAFGPLETWVARLALVYMIAVALRSANGLLDAATDLYEEHESAREVPIRGYVQIAKIALFVVAGIFAIATVLEREPWGLLTGLGALSAVLLLVFRDSILGLVASVQLSGNDMIHVGDWIEMPEFGADGDVLEVNLHTVKVQNWDKTISTIPTHALITHSFKNWRGMQQSGGRRIKRAVYVDVSTIRFCDAEMLERFERFEYLREYLKTKRQELEEYNRAHGFDTSELINGRRLTNVGTFRAYIEEYLRKHPKVHPGMTFLVRQLAPSERGLPIEIYVFSSDQEWARYEAIQADIFDHVLAVAPLFELAVYQSPSGSDVRAAARILAAREREVA